MRTVEHEGEVLETIVTKKRDKKAALKLLKKLMKRYGRVTSIVTDRLRSYGAAMVELGCGDKQDVRKWQNNRVENSHLPFRRREYAMQHFRKEAKLQKFTSIHTQLHNHFNGERHIVDRQTFKCFRKEAVAKWRSLTT